ncbi:MAG TPA: PfkB family carbohydrate kinase [Longimicrobiales bacterium]|nr:PfkB family carbohydrate kinase [Longimicrobiales bacterium]
MTLGILGSMVWDRIEHPDAPVVDRWGGIAYSLAAGAAALPAGWRIRPLIKLGEDLADAARAFLKSIPGLELGGGLARTPHPNNRVHLRYRDRHQRSEFLTGGVPAWAWEELEPRIAGLDALYVNFISGFELDLRTAGRLRDAIPGLLYADFHSLLLAVGDVGARRPRPLPDRDAWVRAFDVVQVNEGELRLVAGSDPPLDFARAAVQHGPGALLITRGPEGATWIARGGAAAPWRETGPVEVRDAPLERAWPGSDPTGCGDVWGATCFVRLVLGDPLDAAVRAANRAAARNVAHRGADGLFDHLKGEA